MLNNFKENISWSVTGIITLLLGTTLLTRLFFVPTKVDKVPQVPTEWGGLVANDTLLVGLYLTLAGLFCLYMTTRELRGNKISVQLMVGSLVFAWTTLTISFMLQELFGFGTQFTAAPILSLAGTLRILLNAWELRES